ncbi:MAG: FAD-dependent oxidoreductase, partial [Desulfobacterales bacterium]
MKNQSDVIIIGAGAIGVCTAYYLNRAGLAVTVLEKNDVCSGCSYGNAGLVVPSHFIPLAAPGVVAKGLKWMFNPESPFYIKPFPDFRLLTWLWRFARASNHKRMQKSMPLLRDLSFASRDLYQELAEADHAGFELYTKGLLVL